jgi:DNA-binding FadR family transcriptional regulator
VLAQLRSFVAINSALEVDLSGQIGAELRRGVYVGAAGGQADFSRAACTTGARSVIALRSRSGGESAKANVDWHLGVAVASHNELLAGLMTALSRAIYTSTENDRFVDREVRRETARAHRSITAAIRAQDSDAAVRRMERHVYAYAKAVIEVEERTEISIPDTD